MYKYVNSVILPKDTGLFFMKGVTDAKFTHAVKWFALFNVNKHGLLLTGHLAVPLMHFMMLYEQQL